MNNKKKKINTMILMFFIIILSFNKVSATDSKITIKKQTDNIIEGTIETITDEYNKFIEADVEPKSSNVDANKLYYNQLTSDISRNIYNALKKDTTGIGNTSVNFTNQTYNIDVDSFFNDTTYRNNTVTSQIRAYEYDAIVAFCDDNPSIYWYYSPKLTENYSIDKEKKQITYKSVQIISTIEEKDDYKNFNEKLREVVDSINGTSTYEIVKKCHDYICNTVVYKKNEDTKIDQTAYDALINHQGVCDAESRLFQLLCNSKGIECIKLNGRAR